ncbi:MAG: outer membrane beta-barrel protein [Candidatus Kapaibacterium sp.]
MIRLVLIIIFALPTLLVSQGFDWQVSSRHPYEITNKYIGAVGSLSYGYHTGNFPFLERDIVCCNYEEGDGFGVQFGLAGEYWYEHDLAFTASLLYSNINANFRTETFVVKKTNPDLPGFNWTTAYESDISLGYITIDMAVKKRIYNKLNLRAGVDINFNINSSETHRNIVVSPNNIPFSDGTFEKELTNGRIGELSSFVLGVSIGASYDIDLGIERYGEISAITNYTVNSYVEDNSWQNLQAKLMLKAYLGLR